MKKYGVYILWLIFVLYSSVFHFEELSSEQSVIIATMAALYMIVVVRFLIKDKERDTDSMLFLVMLGSFLVRMIFCMFHDYNFSTHDLGELVNSTTCEYSDGHIGYVQYIYENAKLPDFDPSSVWSFYNPPLYYIVAAVFLKINHLFGLDMRTMLENLQLLTMLFATITIYIGHAILKEFGLKDKALLFSTMVLAFHPYFIIGGATLNNDILSILFLFMAILYTIRWYKQSSYKNISRIALAVGLGMMTKISVGLVAPAIAMLFLVKFIKEKKYIAYIKQFVLFGVICIPLGMYWSIRNMMLFDLPMVYVQSLSENSGQYLDMSVWKRINPFDLSNYTSPFFHVNVDTDYHIWTELFKTSIFDEMSVSSESVYKVFLCLLLLFSSIVLAVGSVILGVCKDLQRGAENIWINRFKYVIYLLFMGSYIKFCFGFPQICSMNFRYIVPTILIGAINLGVYIQCQDRKKWIDSTIEVLIFSVSILSSIVFTFVF